MWIIRNEGTSRTKKLSKLYQKKRRDKRKNINTQHCRRKGKVRKIVAIAVP